MEWDAKAIFRDSRKAERVICNFDTFIISSAAVASYSIATTSPHTHTHTLMKDCSPWNDELAGG